MRVSSVRGCVPELSEGSSPGYRRVRPRFIRGEASKQGVTDTSRLEERLSAVERAVLDGDHRLGDLSEVATLAEEIDGLASRLDEIERRIAELEGETEALRGYVGNVQSVNEDVERRASSAFATVDRIEERVEELERNTGADAIEGLERRVERLATTLRDHEERLGTAAESNDEHGFVFGDGVDSHGTTPATNGDRTWSSAGGSDSGNETSNGVGAASGTAEDGATVGSGSDIDNAVAAPPPDAGDPESVEQERIEQLFAAVDEDSEGDRTDESGGLLAGLRSAFR